MQLYIFEKPSQANDVSKIIGIKSRQQGFNQLQNGGVATWCIGHLLTCCDPEEYDPKFKQWSPATLPITPQPFKLKAVTRTKTQLATIKKLIQQASEIVIATDPDREGDLIAWEIINHFKQTNKPINRLYLLGLDDFNIKKALNNIKPATTNGYLAAQSRQYADWLLGINGTRLFTLTNSTRKVRSFGRVQTPTLNILYKRNDEIVNHQPQKYATIHITGADDKQTVFSLDCKKEKLSTEQQQEAEDSKQKNIGLINLRIAHTIADQLKGQNITIYFSSKQVTEHPPKLFELTSLSQYMNKKHGWSAEQTLKVAQSCYEKKILSYPRTECDVLPESHIQDMGKIINAIDENLPYVKGITTANQYRKTTFNDKKVESHHALIPTAIKLPQGLHGDERILYTEVAQRLITQLQDSAQAKVCTGSYLHVFDDRKYPFVANSKVYKTLGWLTTTSKPPTSNGELPDKGEIELNITDSQAKNHVTTPPKHHTEATLLNAMENAHRFVDDAKQAKILKDKEKAGIGTPATRATIIERLVKLNLVQKNKKELIITQDGINYINSLQLTAKDLISPALTAAWEEEIREIEKSNDPKQVTDFLNKITTTLQDLVEKHKTQFKTQAPKQELKKLADCPKCDGELVERNGKYGKFISCNNYPKCTYRPPKK